MNYVIDHRIRPAYLQLYRCLREDIVKGVYPAQTRLPSRRLLATETGLSTITVEHAYDLLVEEGYVEARQRSGYYVIFREGEEYLVSETAGRRREHAEKLADTETHFPIPLLSRTMRRVLTERSEELMYRTPGTGSLELREALKRYLARNRGIHVEAEQIVVGSGAEYLYGQIFALLGRKRIVAIESPAYEKLEQICRAAEIEYRLLPLMEEGISGAALAETDADVLLTTPYRSYPTGVTASASKRHEYVHWGRKGNRVIIESDHDSEFSVASKPAETLFSLASGEKVIYLNTFSRTISPALRVAYMALPDDMAELYEKRFGFYSGTVPTFEQLVLTELLNSGDFERHINRVRRKMRREAASDMEKTL